MFVRSRIDKPLTFRKGGKSWILKPHAVTLIDDPTVTARELKGCYGSRIDVITDDGAYEGSKEGRQPIKKVLQYKQEPPKKSTVLESSKETVKKALENKRTEKTLDDILAEVNEELENDSKKMDTKENVKPNEVKSNGTSDDAVPNNKPTKAPKADTSSDGDTEKTKVDAKPKRTRRAPSNKTTNKNKVKRTRKQV